jgi:hypothetical protein
VANQGSNDVSILLGTANSKGAWTGFNHGERVNSGGSEPLAVQAGSFTGQPSILDLRVTNAGGQIVTIPGIGSNAKGNGFFSNATATTLSVGTTILQAVFENGTGNEFLILQGGILATSAGSVLIDGGVTSVSAASGVLVAGMDTGDFEVVNEESGAVTVEETGDEPSALEVLRNGDQVDVYATFQDRDVPVFYSFAVPVLTDLPESSSVAQATGLEQSDFLLVAILLEGSLLEQLTLSVPESAPGEETFVLFLSPSQVQNRAGAALGDEADETAGVLVSPVVASQQEQETWSVVSALGMLSTQADPWQVAWSLQGLPQAETEQPSVFHLAGEEALLHYRLGRKLAQQFRELFEAVEAGVSKIKDWLPVEPAASDAQVPAQPGERRGVSPPVPPTSGTEKERPLAEEGNTATAEEPPGDQAILPQRPEVENEVFACVELLPLPVPCVPRDWGAWLPESEPAPLAE